MDNLTHGLWGVGIYGAWLSTQPVIQHSPLSAAVFAAALIGSEAPDADYAFKLVQGPLAYLKQHRGISHSLPLLLAYALVIAGGLSLWLRGGFWTLFVVALAGCAVHVILDMLTPYGTQALWPFTNQRFRMDVLFTVDPLFYLLAAAGFLFPSLGFPLDVTMLSCFAIAIAYIVARALYGAWLARKAFAAQANGQRGSVLPTLLPWIWHYVEDTGKAIECGKLTAGGQKRLEVRWPRPPHTPQTAAWAMQHTATGKQFTGFARHLIWLLKPDGAAERVLMADATYRFGSWMPFSATISMLKDGRGKFVVESEVIRGQTMDLGAAQQDKSIGRAPAQPRVPTQSP